MNTGKANAQLAGCAGAAVMLVVIVIGVQVADSFSGFLWTVALATVGTMVTGLWVLTKLSSRAEESRQRTLEKLERANIQTTSAVTCIDTGLTLSCDIQNHRLAIAIPGGDISFIPADQVVKIAIDIDGRTIVRIDNISAAVGGLVGSALAGKTGTLLGVLSAKKRYSRKVFTVSVQVITSSGVHPFLNVCLLDDSNGIVPAEPAYRTAIVAAERFQHDADRLMRSAR
jgi:general stress protein CsbA